MNLKFSKLEGKIIDFLENHLLEIFLIIITLLAFYIRFKFRGFKSGDFKNCLYPWFMGLKNNGGLMAIKDYSGDYNAPYITLLALLTYVPLKPIILIKGVSIVFDFAMALAGALLAYKLLKNNKHQKFITALVYGIILFLPTVILNSSAWAQCDSIYTTFVLLALVFLIDEKYTKSFIMLGLALAFKLQFIFILPMFLMVYLLNRKFSILNFLIIPLTTLVCCLPAILLGRPILDNFLIYFIQAEEYRNRLTLNFPNIYYLLPNLPRFFRTAGLIVTVVIFGFMLFILMYRKVKLNKENMILFGLLSIVVATYFLPNMHERYMYMADVISVIYCLVYKRKYWLAITINFVSLIAYFPFLDNLYVFDFGIVAFIYLLVIMYFIYVTFKGVLNVENINRKKVKNG